MVAFFEAQYTRYRGELMTKFWVKISALSLSLLIQSATVYAQETVISVGTSSLGSPTGFSRETLSTTQIDNILSSRAPSLFGQNFTRDRANKAFADLANMKISLAGSAKQAVETAVPKLSVNSLVINTDSLNLRLAQETNSVSAKFGKISGLVSAKYRVGIPLFCTSANISFELSDIEVSGNYNYITGDVMNSNTNYQLTNIKTSCNGLFSSVSNALTGLGRDLVRNNVKNAINSQIAMLNMKSFFSLSDFASGLRYYGNETAVSTIANRAISVLQELVNNASINTPGVAVSFGLKLASSVNQQNKISIIASSSDTNYNVFPSGSPSETFFVTLSSVSDSVDFYKYEELSGCCALTYLGSTSSGVFQAPPGSITEYSTVYAVARNRFIPGLETEGKVIMQGSTTYLY